MQNTSSNYITVVEESCINSNDCLSFYMPVLSDFKIENEFNIKKQQEKVNILKEILSSEKKYLNDIKEIVEVGYFICKFELDFTFLLAFFKFKFRAIMKKYKSITTKSLFIIYSQI